MSFPEYSDFGKEAKEAHNDDFDTESSLKVNSQGPYGLDFSTITSCSPGCKGPFPSTFSLSWAHSSGFAIDNMVVAGCDNVSVEASLTNLAPGLTMKFNGEKAGAGSLGAVYNHPLATVATSVDIAGFSSLSASVLGGSKGLLAGASANFGLKGGFEVSNYSAAVGWAPTPGTFAGVEVNNKLADISATVQHAVRPNLSLTAAVEHGLKAACTKASIGGTFNCCKNTSVKMKVDTEGMINAAVKREFPKKKLTVTGAAAVDSKNLQAYNVGVTATLG